MANLWKAGRAWFKFTRISCKFVWTSAAGIPNTVIECGPLVPRQPAVLPLDVIFYTLDIIRIYLNNTTTVRRQGLRWDGVSENGIACPCDGGVGEGGRVSMQDSECAHGVAVRMRWREGKGVCARSYVSRVGEWGDTMLG